MGRIVVNVGDRVKLIMSEAGFTFELCLYDDDIKAIIDTGADVRSMDINPFKRIWYCTLIIIMITLEGTGYSPMPKPTYIPVMQMH